jgi:DNA-binding MarR family transcriptional regulator
MSISSEGRTAWQLLSEVLAGERSRLPAIADDLGLSEAQCHVLRELDPEAPIAMCRVAEALGCDPSNVTGIVRRLEERKLVERRADERDRRVKQLVLTLRGRALRQQLLDALSEPPSMLESLSPADQKMLCAILRRAVGRED